MNILHSKIWSYREDINVQKPYQKIQTPYPFISPPIANVYITLQMCKYICSQTYSLTTYINEMSGNFEYPQRNNFSTCQMQAHMNLTLQVYISNLQPTHTHTNLATHLPSHATNTVDKSWSHPWYTKYTNNPTFSQQYSPFCIIT